jgi:hypothetical protein
MEKRRGHDSKHISLSTAEIRISGNVQCVPVCDFMVFPGTSLIFPYSLSLKMSLK